MRKVLGVVLGLFLFVVLLPLAAGPAGAQSKFPEKPVTLIVHAGAGGGSDIFARMLASGFQADMLLPQPVIVENKPGGSGAIAFAYVAGKKKDPYFMLTAVVSLLTTPLMGKMPITYKNFTPLANLAFDEYVIIAKSDSKYRSMKEIVAAARENPRKVIVGGAQMGSADSICNYLIEKEAGVKLNYIVFNSGGEVNAALLGGHVDIAISNPGEAVELIKSGKVKALGTFSEKRLEAAPNIPTLREQGINATYVVNRGLVGPADIPADARRTLQEALHKYYESDSFKKYAKDNMITAAWMDGEKYGKWMDGENIRYTEILRAMNLIK